MGAAWVMECKETVGNCYTRLHKIGKNREKMKGAKIL